METQQPGPWKCCLLWCDAVYGSCNNWCFIRTYRLYHQVTRIGEIGTTLSVTSNQTRCEEPSSSILVTMMRESIHCSETSVVIRATWRNIQADCILHSECCETFNFYNQILIFDRKCYLQRNIWRGNPTGPLASQIPYVLYKTNSVTFRPQANYTDWATATCCRN
jgi:hypothetical protein